MEFQKERECVGEWGLEARLRHKQLGGPERKKWLKGGQRYGRGVKTSSLFFFDLQPLWPRPPPSAAQTSTLFLIPPPYSKTFSQNLLPIFLISPCLPYLHSPSKSFFSFETSKLYIPPPSFQTLLHSSQPSNLLLDFHPPPRHPPFFYIYICLLNLLPLLDLLILTRPPPFSQSFSSSGGSI